ncbi:MAG: 3-deoxy-D-manno-octulosonic acid transferase [Thermodesulfovibrionales bacterium]
MRFLYSLLYCFALVFLLPFHYFKRPKDIRSRWLKQKFGILSLDEQLQPSIWMHAVSVGETLGARRLVDYLKERFPKSLILFSTMTDTGQEIARRELLKDNPQRLFIFYMPFDISFIIKRILKRYRVCLFITMETEIWPNIFQECKRLRIPVIVANARLSEKSMKGYRKIGFFMRPVLGAVNAFCCSSKIDKERLNSLGVEGSRIHITGNLKFDMPPPEKPALSLRSGGRIVIVIGSTHSGEERLILQSLKELIKSGRVFVILAPRHPERFDEVAGLLTEEDIKFIRKTQLSNNNNEFDTVGYEILLLDTIGELSSIYSLADIVILGGSFVPLGGHNLLEPAYWSKPVICGRHMDNFPLAEEFFKEGAAIQAGPEDIVKYIIELCDAPEKRLEIGKRARLIYERNRGALERTVKVIEEIMTPEILRGFTNDKG